MLLCLGEPLVRFLCCCCSFLMCIFICRSSSFVCCCSSFISRLLYHVTRTPSWLLKPVKTSTSLELYLDYFLIAILLYASSPLFLAQPAFIKASRGAGSSPLKFAVLHTDSRNTDPTHLFVWFTVIHKLHVQNDSVLNSIMY